MENGDPIPFHVKNIRFEGPSITWAGECPWVNGSEKGFAFGTEDGSIWFSDLHGSSGNLSETMIPSGEAINGMAFSGKLMAASTRAEVVINHFDEIGGPKRNQRIYEGGAHGVVATARGGIIATLGPMGLLLVEPEHEGRYIQREIRAEERDLYYYKVASLGLTKQGGEIFACAGRTDGIMAVEIGPKGQLGRIINSRGQDPSTGTPLDIIDVCALKVPEHPHAVASLGIDGSLHLSHDIFLNWSHIALHLSHLSGTPYSVHVAQGHLFIHTSEAVHVVPELVTRFLQGQSLIGRTYVPSFPCDAMDCSIAYDEHLLLTLGKTVQAISISEWLANDSAPESDTLLTNGRGSERRRFEMISDMPDYGWTDHPIHAKEQVLAG